MKCNQPAVANTVLYKTHHAQQNRLSASRLNQLVVTNQPFLSLM